MVPEQLVFKALGQKVPPPWASLSPSVQWMSMFAKAVILFRCPPTPF